MIMSTDEFTLTDTEETIQQSIEADEAYSATGRDYQERARLLLDAGGEMLSGNERDNLQAAIDGDIFDMTAIDRLWTEFAWAIK